MSTILITGGTGLLGHRLATLLTAQGHTVNLLSRSNNHVPPYTNVFIWDVEAGEMDDSAFTNCDYIVHLAGAGIADKPWTGARKKEVIDSRVNSSNLLFEKLKKRAFLLTFFLHTAIKRCNRTLFSKTKMSIYFYEKHHLHPLLPVLRSLVPKCRSAIRH